MAKIFAQQEEINEHPNLNNFDLFFQNHMTMKAGIAYPFLCKPTVPGDVFRINTKVGIKAMPLVFPTQSHMRAKVLYGYVPERIIWDNFKDKMAGVDKANGLNYEHPYIAYKGDSDFFKTGSLADYLDVPSTYVNTGDTIVSFLVHGASKSEVSVSDGAVLGADPDDPTVTAATRNAGVNTFAQFLSCNFEGSKITRGGRYSLVPYSFEYRNVIIPFTVTIKPSTWQFAINEEFYNFITAIRATIGSGALKIGLLMRPEGTEDVATANWIGLYDDIVETSGTLGDDTRFYFDCHAVGDELDTLFANGNNKLTLGIFLDMHYGAGANSSYYTTWFPKSIAMQCSFTEGYDITPAVANEVYGTGDGAVRLNALPFRAYEAFCNLYLRNDHIDPLIVDGKKVYNKFNQTTADGADETPYELFKVNWEKDAYTSALPSPMEGVAPLVGMTALGTISITDTEGNVTQGQYQFANDGHTFTGDIAITNPAQSDENNRTLKQNAMALAGMSIYDFRSVNAYTRFLEVTARKGLRYYDFIKGHFNRGPKKAELDMPLFIGGMTQEFVTTMVTQTSQGSDDNPLGSYAGQTNAFGGSKHDVNFTCDDFGWLLGIVYIIPDPAYSQVLPKHFLMKDRFDYYFPEFANLGLQPIPYGEICPVQAIVEGSKALTDTFGYQRPNYDLVHYNDQVHGQFRLSLRNMLINRVFASTPELGTEFIHIQPEEVSNIFAVDAPDEDNFIGQIVVDVKAKRPIPRISLPSLGR